MILVPVVQLLRFGRINFSSPRRNTTLTSPRRFHAEVASRLNAGGLLVLVLPYTWLQEYTKRDGWIGGFKRDDESYWTRPRITGSSVLVN